MNRFGQWLAKLAISTLSACVIVALTAALLYWVLSLAESPPKDWGTLIALLLLLMLFNAMFFASWAAFDDSFNTRSPIWTLRAAGIALAAQATVTIWAGWKTHTVGSFGYAAPAVFIVAMSVCFFSGLITFVIALNIFHLTKVDRVE